jgi:hypothetical protein
MDSTTAIDTTATLHPIATPDEVAQPAQEVTTLPAALAEEDPAVESSEEGTPAAPSTPLLEAEADAPVVQNMDVVGAEAQGDEDQTEASSQEDRDQAGDEGSKKRKREESDDPSQAAEESDAQPPEDSDAQPIKEPEAEDEEPPSKRQAVESPEDPQLELNDAQPEVGLQEGPNEDQTSCSAEEAELPPTPVLAGKVLVAEADDVRSEALKVEE